MFFQEIMPSNFNETEECLKCSLKQNATIIYEDPNLEGNGFHPHNTRHLVTIPNKTYPTENSGILISDSNS